MKRETSSESSAKRREEMRDARSEAMEREVASIFSSRGNYETRSQRARKGER